MHRYFVSALLVGMVACSGDPAAPAPDQSSLQGGEPDWSANVDRGLGDGAYARDLATLARVTAPFHRLEVAQDAGWSTPLTGCLFLPGVGAMGVHYADMDLVLDGRVAVDEPELLVYEPQKNGRMRLVAVEYIVPFGTWTSAEPPQLFGREFHRNEGFGIWALHVWLWRHNPMGLFADWNPNVTCEHAQ